MDLATTLGRHSDVLRQLGDREPASLIEAQAVIESIRADKGYLDNETLQDLRSIRQQSREQILRLVQGKRETEAAYTMSISEQLYSSKFRFLYELIQNADDSSYVSLTTPYVRFDITPKEFVVETNEIGFTRKNIEAICATGRSSKKATLSDDHIGEKGFGFKSVFSIAEEVQIQSGWWSFCFRHRRGEDGLGMVTPLDATPAVLPQGVKTRISLRYSTEVRQDYQRLLEAVEELPDTTLLFLQRLREIHINILDTAGRCEKTCISKEYDIGRHQCTIQRRTTSQGVTTDEVCRYHIFRNTVRQMPPNERRRGRSEAKVELAFPFDPVTQQPKLSSQGQYVFAFLPLQRLSHVQFLIHSDFVTSASRETVVDCPWNLKLCGGIAKTFVSAVTGTFAKLDHPCKHSWLDWLPESGMERPWRTLYKSVVERLTEEPVAQTWEKRQFKAPKELRIVVPSARHCEKPILPDLPDEIYLAPEYTEHHIARLKELGTNYISWDDMVNRLQADLLQIRSRLRTTPSEDLWHEAFAGLFIQAFAPGKTNMTTTKQRIGRLGIIPLINGTQWSGAPGAPHGATFGRVEKVYFAYTEATPIPDTISLGLLDRAASRNVKRKAFYKALGVEDCLKDLVFGKIRERHRADLPCSDIIADLQYMYHQRYDSDDVKSWVQAPLTTGRAVQASTTTFYLPSDGEFDMYQLVPSANRCFLSKTLYDIEPLDVRVNEESWRNWLTRVFSASSHPLLIGGASSFGNGHDLSPSLVAVLRYKSAKFLGTLRAHWHLYQRQAHLVERDLRRRKIPCKSGVHYPLELTNLPTADIMNEIARLGIEEEAVPLLSVSQGTLDEDAYRSWKFLEDFGVASKPNLLFYQQAIESKAKQTLNVVVGIVADIYVHMVRIATIDDHDKLGELFDESYIWDSHRNEWVTRQQCLWAGPDFISSKSVLTRTYYDIPRLDSFFLTILSIPSIKVEDVIQEIEARRDGNVAVTLQLMREIYTYLNTQATRDEEWQLIKNAFTEKRLVLGNNETWSTLSNCLWGSPFELSGLQDLSTIYAEMEPFFVRRLKVKKATLSMLIAEVRRMAEARQPHIGNIKTRLVEIGMMLARGAMNDGISAALSNLKEVKFLPKKSREGTSVLVGVEDDFAISDHQRYSDAFGNSNALLDFQVHEVQTLHTVFRQVGLKHRYLSSMVREVSTVGERCNESEELSRQLQDKAYALYCCAAKYKSNKALHGDRTLFEALSTAVVYTADDITTNLVLPLVSGPISVLSERSVIHSDMSGGEMKIYLPSEPQQRRMCYRSQLPNLLTSMLAVGRTAAFDISTIISSSVEELEEVLAELDIPPVAWIDRPVIVVPYNPQAERPITPSSSSAGGDSATLIPHSGLVTPDTTPTRRGRSVPVVDIQYVAETTPPPDYPAFVDQVVRSAHRAGRRHRDHGGSVVDDVPFVRNYDHHATFGSRERNQFVHDRRIGAAGEGYVFEVLSRLSLPNFTEANWRSTIRGELARSTRFANMANWTGQETADIVYEDDSGELTQYLREHSEGIFPFQIREDRNFRTHPIVYYLEVKTTTGRCGTRFYMSSGQYKRMERLTLGILDSQPSKVYVIIRVYDLMEQDVGMKVFVDPLRFRGTKLDFEAEQWFVNTI